MEDDEYFYPREDRIPEEEDDSTNNKKKRLRISRHVIAPQEGDEYEMDDDDNHKKSKPIIAIQKIIEDTRKDIEDMFRKERDDIMSQDRFKNLDPDDYDSKKDAISRYLENSKYRQLLDKTTFERINEYKRYQRQLPTIFGFSEKEDETDLIEFDEDTKNIDFIMSKLLSTFFTNLIVVDQDPSLTSDLALAPPIDYNN
jgi:hypothetical protein